MDDAIALSVVFLAVALFVALAVGAALAGAIIAVAYWIMLLSAMIYRAFGGKDWRDGTH